MFPSIFLTRWLHPFLLYLNVSANIQIKFCSYKHLALFEPETGFEPVRHKVIRITKPMESSTVPFRQLNTKNIFSSPYDHFCSIFQKSLLKSDNLGIEVVNFLHYYLHSFRLCDVFGGVHN